MDSLLNIAQHRSLEIGLRIVETHLLQARAWLASEPELGTLQQRRVNLSPARRAAILELISVAQGEIDRLAAQFTLASVEQDFAAVFAAEMSTDWATLCDLRAAKLRRYGEVDRRLQDELDPGIQRLIELVTSLASLAHESNPP